MLGRVSPSTKSNSRRSNSTRSNPPRSLGLGPGPSSSVRPASSRTVAPQSDLSHSPCKLSPTDDSPLPPRARNLGPILSVGQYNARSGVQLSSIESSRTVPPRCPIGLVGPSLLSPLGLVRN
ncbi:hypothetical protein TNIN_192921 [Trichonephila inaurata madagascariensis]|uniref:Uncharacterized protein n=1 Tax=Trichonephila inaurata madagascariensis TaxID=2747483 RepID=A0A8X6ISX0_9ARAC|nr:hypothetical protein TNIN_192921 [Trichonephila inaurata madagascariensis]